MAIIKVHGSPFSTATCRVLACLYEKELDFEFVPVDLRSGEHKTKPYLSLNPFGQVPAFEDGDLKLFESRAITQYISHEYANKGTPLEYQDSKKNATLFLWKEVEAQRFDQPSSKLMFELAIKPLIGMETDLAVVEEIEPNLEKVLDVYECQLSKSKYLAGDCFTLADLHHLPNIHWLIGTRSGKLFESRPHVSAWVADITTRPAWSKVLLALKNKP